MSSGGGGDGGAGARQEQEEARKTELRGRIDRLYGIEPKQRRGSASGEPYTTTWTQMGDRWRGVRSDTGEVVETVTPGEHYSQAAFRPGGWRFVGDAGGVAAAGRAQMEEESTGLAKATRGYYTDQLGKNYQDAERDTRFKLARQGLMGGSEDVFQQGEVKSDRDLGATRVDEAVRRAISNLTSQREQERLNAVNLVNAGAGESAVSAAQAGLHNSFENVASAQKADLFTDLFSGAADTATASNLAEAQAAMLGRYRDRLSTFFPNRGNTSSGRVTPSA